MHDRALVVNSGRPGWLRRPLRLTLLGLSWLLPLALLAWAIRLDVVEGYLFPMGTDFLGDFTRTAELGAPTWWTGQGMFYGPIFVLEYRFLLAPHILSGGDFARLDFVLFGAAFACAWWALFGGPHPRLAIVVLALWLLHHASVEAFSNTAHLEILELACMSAALLLAVRGRTLTAGGMLGLAVATKTLPGLFLPYLALMQQWRLLLGATVASVTPFLVVCWLQGLSIGDGLYALIYQGGNLTKLEYTEYEYTLRADFARIIAHGAPSLSAADARLAITLHWVVALVIVVFGAWVMQRSPLKRSTYGLTFGLIMAVMLVVAPSAHIPYYIFLLPAWTAMAAELVRRPLSGRTAALWAALACGYTFSGFDQPFFLLQRLIGIGIVVPQNWLPWHLPTLALLLTLVGLAALLVTTSERRFDQPLTAYAE